MMTLKNYDSFINEKANAEQWAKDAASMMDNMEDNPIFDDLKKEYEESGKSGYVSWTQFVSEIAKDPKAKKAFRYCWEQMAHNDITVEKGEVVAAGCIPTQSEIDCAQSIAFPLGVAGKGNEMSVATDEALQKCWKDDFSGKTIYVKGSRILVYTDGKDNYIIDGHHRWSGVCCVNPKAKLGAYIIKSEKPIDWSDVLKISQAAISQVQPDSKSGLPVANVQEGGLNLLKATKEEVIQFAKELVNDGDNKNAKFFKKGFGTADAVIEAIKKSGMKIENPDKLTIDKVIEGIAENATNSKILPRNLQADATERKWMPQSDAALQDKTKEAESIDTVAAEINRMDAPSEGSEKKEEKNESRIIRSFDSFVNEGLIDTFKMNREITKVQGACEDEINALIEKDPKKYTSGRQLMNAIERKAIDAYKKNVKANFKEAIDEKKWWENFSKAYANMLDMTLFNKD